MGRCSSTFKRHRHSSWSGAAAAQLGGVTLRGDCPFNGGAHAFESTLASLCISCILIIYSSNVGVTFLKCTIQNTTLITQSHGSEREGPPAAPASATGSWEQEAGSGGRPRRRSAPPLPRHRDSSSQVLGASRLKICDIVLYNSRLSAVAAFLL